MDRPGRELMAEFHPGVPIDPALGPHDTLLSIAQASRVLGYQPRDTWRR